MQTRRKTSVTYHADINDLLVDTEEEEEYKTRPTTLSILFEGTTSTSTSAEDFEDSDYSMNGNHADHGPSEDSNEEPRAGKGRSGKGKGEGDIRKRKPILGISGPFRGKRDGLVALFQSGKKGDTQVLAECREWAFKKCWKSIQQEIHDSTEKVYSVLFQKAFEFLNEAKNHSSSVAAGLIMKGFDYFDSTEVSRNLRHYLIQKKANLKVAILRATDCVSLRATLDIWLTSLKMGQNFDELAENCENLDTPIVAIFEDFENFKTEVIQDCINLCCSYQSRINFVLFFGISSGPESIYRKLTFSITTHLFQKELCFPHPDKIFQRIVTRVFLSSEIPIKLGAKSLRFLEETNNNLGLSISNLTKIFKIFSLDTTR